MLFLFEKHFSFLRLISIWLSLDTLIYIVKCIFRQSKYLNQRLLHYSQKFAADSDYIFFSYSVLQKVQLSSQIHVTMKKIISNNLTAVMLTKNLQQRVKELIARDKALSFMSSI